MKAIIKEDMITKLSVTAGVEIGALPKGIGLERLRWTGSELVDLMDLTEMWVRYKNGQFELHAIEVDNSQLVEVTYPRRKALVVEDGIIRALTEQEIADRLAERAAKQAELQNLKEKLEGLALSLTYDDIDDMVETNFADHTAQQRGFLKNIAYVALYFAKREARG